MPKVLIATPTLAGLEGPFLHLLRDAGFEVVHPRQRKPLTEEELLAELKGVAATVAGWEPYTRRVMESSPELRVIARNGVGYDAVDVAAATERGVAVTVTPGVNQESVAEHTFALMLALARSVVPQHTAIRSGAWRRDAGVPLRGRNLGLVGLGRIGREVALRAATFRMRVLAHEPVPDVRFVERHRIALVPLDQLLAESDFVSLHVPLSNESRHLIDARALGLMKPTAFLINTARGGLICEADLVRALRDGRIAGAGLDVFTEEPPPPDHPLTRLENVICTAHTAGIDLQARDDMALLAAGAIVALRRGQWPEQQVINPECRANFRWS
jgi:D-3-phosphoglycerate dehydrogenase / 2-oxoglutarate reductase